MVPFVKGDPEHDFWKQNPEMKFIPPFDELVKKKDSSKIMWGIYLWKDPKSIWNRIGVIDRQKEVEDNYLKGKVNLEDYKYYAEEYEKKCLSIREKAYIHWTNEVEEFFKYFQETTWKQESKEKREMLKDMKMIWKYLEEAQIDATEEHQYRVEGDRTESILETGEI